MAEMNWGAGGKGVGRGRAGSQGPGGSPWGSRWRVMPSFIPPRDPRSPVGQGAPITPGALAEAVRGSAPTRWGHRPGQAGGRGPARAPKEVRAGSGLREAPCPPNTQLADKEGTDAQRCCFKIPPQDPLKLTLATTRLAWVPPAIMLH